MARKIRKRDVDVQLLDSIFIIDREWKQIQSLLEKSVEPTESGIAKEEISRANYLFLLREARRRNISAIRYRV
ncbi:YaaL family protein [Virgibacillus byunsanensis]|uniref:YaaL family protein n=1 Tax=Virgibacillus byunsanensis TaxID=570945 RepID=A0ABW3LRC3_9BACI